MSTSGKAAYHHGDLREALLAAGLAILEEGMEPASISLREAARRVGVSAMAPYRHFADKDSLLSDIATIGFTMLSRDLRDADGQSDRLSALKAQGVAYVAFACAHPALFRLMFGPKAPAKTADLAETAQATYRILADRIASLAPPEASADRTLASWSLVHGLAILAIDGHLSRFDADPVALATRIMAESFGTSSQKGMLDPSQAKKPPLSEADRPSKVRKR